MNTGQSHNHTNQPDLDTIKELLDRIGTTNIVLALANALNENAYHAKTPHLAAQWCEARDQLTRNLSGIFDPLAP